VFEVFDLRCLSYKSWHQAKKKLKAWNTENSKFVREVIIYFYELNRSRNRLLEVLPDALAVVLAKISSTSLRLAKVFVLIDEDCAKHFEACFVRHNLLFPTVQTLAVSPYNDYMLKHCPNVETLSGDQNWQFTTKGYLTREHSLRLMRGAASLPKLKYFMVEECWTETLFDALYREIPNIEILTISDIRTYQMPFERFAFHMSRFHHINDLHIPSASALNVGFEPPEVVYPGIECINLEDIALAEQVEMECREVEERTAAILFNQCLSLKRLSFGEYTMVAREEHSHGVGKRQKLIWSRGHGITGLRDWVSTVAWIGHG